MQVSGSARTNLVKHAGGRKRKSSTCSSTAERTRRTSSSWCGSSSGAKRSLVNASRRMARSSAVLGPASGGAWVGSGLRRFACLSRARGRGAGKWWEGYPTGQRCRCLPCFSRSCSARCDVDQNSNKPGQLDASSREICPAATHERAQVSGTAAQFTKHQCASTEG